MTTHALDLAEQRLAPTNGVAPVLSVVVPLDAPGLWDSEKVSAALRSLASLTEHVGGCVEVIVAGSESDRAARAAATATGARFVEAEEGFGSALREGLAASTADYVLTVDGPSAASAEIGRELWKARGGVDVVVGSRYVPGADARMTTLRRAGSRGINRLFGRGLSLGVADMSSGFRLYKREVLAGQQLTGTKYDVLPEMLARALAAGWTVREVPVAIDLRSTPRSVRPFIQQVAAYVRTFAVLWRLRNSIEAADYDARAYDSIIPLQRYWQRSRYRHVTDLIDGQGAVLDVGCGSSRIITALPPGSVALDVLANKLRYARRFSRRLVRASGLHLPFADASFPCVLCSQVIEHVPLDSPILSELDRVLQLGGRLVLGTPDYDNWQWIYMERAYGFFNPGGYADEHIAHYTRKGLLKRFESLGYMHEETRYILSGELILAFRKQR